MRFHVLVGWLCLALVAPLITAQAREVEKVSYRTLLSRNLGNLQKLEIGMSRDQVMAIMGDFQSETKDSIVPNPYKIEPFSDGGVIYEVLYYLTERYQRFTPIELSQATPVVLKNGFLIGLGAVALRKARSDAPVELPPPPSRYLPRPDRSPDGKTTVCSLAAQPAQPAVEAPPREATPRWPAPRML